MVAMCTRTAETGASLLREARLGLDHHHADVREQRTSAGRALSEQRVMVCRRVRDLTAPQRDPVAWCTRCRRAQSSATLLRAWSQMTDKASELSKTARPRPEPTGKDLGARE